MNCGRVVYTQDGPFSEPIAEEIELESTEQLEFWLREYSKIENIIKGIKLEHIPYSCLSISNELARREIFEEMGQSTFSWDALPQYALTERE